jgi:hypothetical protein
MFDDQCVAFGLDIDVSCCIPLPNNQRCADVASWSVRIGGKMIPCCYKHMEQVIDMHRANKNQYQMFKRAMVERQDDEHAGHKPYYFERESESLRDLEPETDNLGKNGRKPGKRCLS